MEQKRILKIINGGVAKRVNFPNSFKELEEKAKEFIPINESNKKYQFIEESAQREVDNQEDFALLSRDLKDDKTIKISIRVIDKPLDNSEHNISLSNISQKKSEEEVNSIKNIDEIKIEEPEEKMKREIQEIVNSKMKNLEENIAQDIFQSIKLQLVKSEQENNNNLIFNENKNMSNLKIVHDGIKCNNCGEENIEGIRYKCTVCPDFNLCQKCETEAIHPPSHIFIKMRRPVKDEDLKLDKDKCKYSYKNEDYDFTVDDRNLIFSIENKENGTLAKQIAITNNGFEDWNPGAKFKCLDSSQLKGKDYTIESRINRGDTVNIEIIFEDFKKDLGTFKDEYDVYYQMFNSDNEAFGNITKFKVIFKNE